MWQYFVGKILKEEEMVSITFMKQLDGNNFFWPADVIIENVEKEQVFDWNVRVTHDKNNPKFFLISYKDRLDSNAKKLSIEATWSKKKSSGKQQFLYETFKQCMLEILFALIHTSAVILIINYRVCSVVPPFAQFFLLFLAINML